MLTVFSFVWSVCLTVFPMNIPTTLIRSFPFATLSARRRVQESAAHAFRHCLVRVALRVAARAAATRDDDDSDGRARA